jgi:apolipoprotein N-acyltransferase
MSVFLTLSSALLLPLSLPNEFLMWGATIPGLVALVPVLIAVYRTPSRVHASRIGMLFGIINKKIILWRTRYRKSIEPKRNRCNT